MLLGSVASGCYGDTPKSPPQECRNPPKRLEWRQMSEPQQKSYIDAVLCLTMTESISGIARAINRFDDHQAVHAVQTPNIHWVGHFILWHRYLVATYEKALREECGYEGGQPSRVSMLILIYQLLGLVNGRPPRRPHLHGLLPRRRPRPRQVLLRRQRRPGHPHAEAKPLNLTGGTGGGCVRDGAFTPDRFRVNYGPDPGCLKRDFVPWIFNSFADPKLVEEVLEQPDYASFARTIEKVPTFDAPNVHGSGHFGIGGVLGTIGNAENSPGDPLFYLHHGNLDRILWMWQQQDLETRLNQVGGPIVPMDYGGQNVTLDFTVNLGELAGDATLKQLLDTQGGVLCYTY
ncbi:hypothetical protein PG990_006920 [Apiospora arundinis]